MVSGHGGQIQVSLAPVVIVPYFSIPRLQRLIICYFLSNFLSFRGIKFQRIFVIILQEHLTQLEPLSWWAFCELGLFVCSCILSFFFLKVISIFLKKPSNVLGWFFFKNYNFQSSLFFLDEASAGFISLDFGILKVYAFLFRSTTSVGISLDELSFSWYDLL